MDIQCNRKNKKQIQGMILQMADKIQSYSHHPQLHVEPIESIARGRMRHSQRNTSTGQIKSLA